ncbi:hypothetical protein P170DRAFT_355037 [Aspergillus steynii IBT 23096]|uniref:DUF1760-domain-containing protein n=1 Tax=Aspergillus steynii IBT 23096 TaxID=1392250 RepID=A0A2I2GEE8_9EURO|nr:uncharacterized protein P170DRAFT_355037 [Aspergillus steynii IBT 23096]PLB51207.1 hypothetical protein P170DRAFT_355037 [Aspergillus steynii IBT 23096]
MDDHSVGELRNAARDALQQRNSASVVLPESRLASIAIPADLGWLKGYVSSQNDASNTEICETLLFALGFLKGWGSRSLSEQDKDSVNYLYEWASSAALPSPVFAEIQELDEKRDLAEEDQLRSNIAMSVINLLAELLPIHDAENASDIIIALASFTSNHDPWTSPETQARANALLTVQFTSLRSDPDENEIFWATIEDTLKQKIRPLFAKTKNPAITASGRKNFHPVPLPRFDASMLDPETKPWKIQNVYATTVLSWIIAQYQATDRDHLEAHFPLLVPAILTLIDDDSLPFKIRGCHLASDLLIPISGSKSDILRRTNLSSVFEDAIRPCLLSLPSITPEDESIELLSAAYPALLSVLKTNAQNSFPIPPQIATEAYIASITKTLRENLIPSFHHISSATSASTPSSFASFPHPRLSTLLLDLMHPLLLDLGVHAAKYLQDITPLVHTTLSNPFGPAHPPLLLSAVGLLRAVILTTHPRLWRWRGEILGALCACWLHTMEEESEMTERAQTGQLTETDRARAAETLRLKKDLRGVSYLLKFALQNPERGSRDAGQIEAKESIEKELRKLVEADHVLEGLFDMDFDTTDAAYFGVRV